MTARFEIIKGQDDQFYWHLKAPNGEIICQSEGYTTKESAKTGIRSVKDNASKAAIVEAV
ncbi:YegP family protein [Maricaulis sp. CAU 1757]